MNRSLISRTTVAISASLMAVAVPISSGLAGEPVAGANKAKLADYNGDGYSDLAIGTINEDVGSADAAGSVNVLYGGSSGLTADNDQLWTQDSPGVSDVAENSDRFGSALASGDFNNDGFADLAVGSSGEDVLVGLDNVESAGIVQVLLGSSNGLGGNDSAPIQQGFDLTPGSSDAFDFFGGTLAAGNFGAGPADDLAVGATGEVLDGDDFAGAVTVFNNSPAGIGTKGVKVWHQDKKGLKDSAEESEYLGGGLAAGDLGKSHQAELVIGVPYENVVNGGEGAVHVLYGSDNGLKSGGQQFLHGNTPGVNGPALYDSAFGQALTVANFGRGSQGDLAIGAPRRSVDGFMHGSVHVLYGSPTGVTIKGDQLWNQNTPGVTGKVQYVNLIGEGFGWDLVGANFGGSKYADLAVGVPYQTVDGFDLAGATQVLFGSEKGLTAAGDLYLTQKSAGVPSDPALNDSFGYTLAGGGFGRSARKDLAITSRDEDSGAAAAAGSVTVLYGSPNGPNTTTGEVWSQDTLNVEGAAATSDRFGNALAP